MDALFIKVNRKKKGLTQKELGEILGVSKRTIINWENRYKKISKKNMEKLKKYLTNKKDMLKMQ